MSIKIHPTADVSDKAKIGEGTTIWHQCQVMPGAKIGEGCILGKGVFIDAGVSLGDHVKVQNYVSIYHGVTIEKGVFIGPHVCFTNDLLPRSINVDGTLKAGSDWEVSETRVRMGASLGANSTIRCGVTIGEWAMVGSGSVITRDVPKYGLIYGNPAQLHGFVCACGVKVEKKEINKNVVIGRCPKCGNEIEVPLKEWEKIK